jgi:hypothetical protein
MHPYTDQRFAALAQHNVTNQPLVESQRARTITDSHTALDVSGINVGDHGHSCCRHGCCRNYVAISDVLFLRRDHQFINGHVLDCICGYKVNRITGLTTCHVGYIPEFYIQATDRSYRMCRHDANRGRSGNKHGMVCGKIIIDCPLINGKNCHWQPIIIQDNDAQYPKIMVGIDLQAVEDYHAQQRALEDNEL